MIRRIFTMLLLTAVMGFAAQNEASAQIFSTKLKITVLDELGNVVPDAKVLLFKNKADWEKEANEVQPFKLTNIKGQVTFKKLTQETYYVLVRKGDKDNIGRGEKVEKMVAKKLNKRQCSMSTYIKGTIIIIFVVKVIKAEIVFVW